MTAPKLKAMFILDDIARKKIYNSDQEAKIAELVDIYPQHYTQESILENLQDLKDIDIVISGWGGPRIDHQFLDAAPNLKAVFYGAGSIRPIVSPAFWAANIALTSAAPINAIPVAEFTLSQILFCLKLGWQHNQLSKSGHETRLPVHGAYNSTIGLISMGAIAKRVRKLLMNHEVNVVAYDPFMDESSAKEWNVELVSLSELFERSSVVSLHSPDLPETKGMIKRSHFEALPKWASFINTARSATVCHTDLCNVLEQRPDLWAVLDVTEEATDEERNRLIKLPNVSMTPHIAGSTGPEAHRMGEMIIDEINRFLNKEPLEYLVTEEQSRIMA